jgi:hypothetical protein
MTCVDQSTQPHQRLPGQFQPGKSGNPSGASKAEWQLTKGARIYGPEMLALCAKIARDEDLPAKVRLQAADMILDRGYGKPIQQVAAHIEQHHFVVAPPVAPDALAWQASYGAPLIEGDRPKRIRPVLVN